MKQAQSKRKNKPYNEWSKKSYDNFRDYQIKYYKENYRTFAIKFNRQNDADIINFLESQENIARWVRFAVQKELKKKGSAK